MAVALLSDPPDRLVISTQVLSEFYWTVTRKLRPPLPDSAAAEATRHLAALPLVTIDGEIILSAIDTAQHHQLALWDAMIVEAAVRSGCDRLLTEDLTDGQEIRGILIANPFAA